MPSFFRNRKLIVFLTGLIIIVALIGYSMQRDTNNVVSQFVLDTVGFFQNIIHTPVTWVVDIVDDIREVQDLYEQNEILKSELQEFKSLAFEVNDLRRENEDLRALAEIEESLSDYNYVKGTVIARSPERWFEQVTINRGQQHGIAVNMAVTTGEGMVGKVTEVSQLTSTVQLLSGFDENNRISALIEDGDDQIFGLIEGYDSESESLIFRDLDNDMEIEEGQTVVSSGLGGVFPRGLLIGTVDRVEMDPYGLTMVAYVTPAAELYNINHLMVVDRDLHSPVIDEDGEEE